MKKIKKGRLVQNRQPSPLLWIFENLCLILIISYSLQVAANLMPESKYYLFLEVDGKTQPSKEVVVATVPNLIFVQTDRGIYKPSASLNDETTGE